MSKLRLAGQLLLLGWTCGALAFAYHYWSLASLSVANVTADVQPTAETTKRNAIIAHVAGSASSPERDSPARPRSAIWNNPEYRKLAALQYGRTLDRRYGTLFRRAGTDGVDLDALKQLLAERFFLQQEACAIASEQHVVPTTRSEADKFLQEVAAPIDAQLSQMLPPEDFRYLQSLDETAGTREALQPYTTRLEHTPNALSDAQIDQLARLVSGAVSETSGSVFTLSDDIVAKTDSFLTPPQRELLAHFARQQAALQQMLTFAETKSSLSNPSK